MGVMIKIHFITILIRMYNNSNSNILVLVELRQEAHIKCCSSSCPPPILLLGLLSLQEGWEPPAELLFLREALRMGARRTPVTPGTE